MSTRSHPLEALVGPLRFASARDFANLATVKGLRGLLSGAIVRARGSLAPDRVATLERAAARIDAGDEGARRAAILEVLGVLQSEGVVSGGAGVEAPAQVSSPSPPGEGKKALREAPTPRVPEDAPARVLSIAPRTGPLAAPIKSVPWRVNPRLLGQLNKKGMRRLGDVLFLLPRAYEDRRALKKIAQLRGGERATIMAVVRHAEETRFGRRMFRATLADDTGSLAIVHFQTGSWLKSRYPIGRRLVVSGELRQSHHGWEMAHPEVEPADDAESSPLHFNRIVPIYPGFERNEQRSLRELAYRLVEGYAGAVEDPLPEALRARQKLLGLSATLRALHFPDSGSDLRALEAHQSPAHRRLAFDELFFLQLGLALRRHGVKVQPGIAFDTGPEVLTRALGLLPFAPTSAQQRVVQELARDLARPEPMNRLLQGDVGSGKTAVAVVAAAVVVQGGYQVAVMVPTEILAEQHHRTFSRLLAPLGVEVALLTGAAKAAEKRALRRRIASGEIAVAVGTHALIEQEVEFHRLGLVVIDEQHRFGVIQRHALMAKGPRPGVLVMTATPIPRTLAMTLYGDLEVSLLDELPPGRTPIETRVYVARARQHLHQRLRAELEQGRQAYVVYPLVEESEKVDLADATKGAKELGELLVPHRVGLLHGRMAPEEKNAVMRAFRDHQLDVLVATTVVEVGVDVPNASVMLIEHAERFGLSQLHQLRGRVGRGAARSFCWLLAGYAKSEEARARLAVMEETGDGFLIAERDLELRGAGEFLGTRQSGAPELAVANLARDQALLAVAREEARALVEADPRLVAPEHAAVARALEERWEGRLQLARVG